MKTNLIFWAVQFVNLCIVSSTIILPPAKFSIGNGLPDGERYSTATFAESNETRTVDAIEPPRDTEATLLKTNETEADTTELNIPMHIKENVEEDVTTELQTNVTTPLEESPYDVPVNIHETEDLTISDEDADAAGNNNDTYTENIRNDMNYTDVNRGPLQHPRTELPPAPKLTPVETQKEKIRNSLRTVNLTAMGDYKTKKGRLTIPIQRFQQDDEESDVLDLIREVKFFESHRTAPKRPDLLLNIPRRIYSAPSEAVVLTKGYFNTNLQPLSAARRFFEKMSDPAKQKTLLETALTADRVSAQATNENASSVSELDVAQRDDTSIRNLSHPEDVDDVKRVARSHASDPNEELKDDRRSKSSSPRDRTENQVEAEAVPLKHFKRPPRVLPFRHLSKEETDTNKFANSKERAISLFNKSNEARRKQVSLLVNRSDSNLSRINSTKSSYSTTTEQTETESGSLDGRVNLLIEENVPGSFDAVPVDVEEKVNKDA